MNENLEIYFEEYSLFTSFSCGNKIIENVQIELKFTDVFPSKIKGKIIGDVITYNKLVPLLNSRINNDKFAFDSSKVQNQNKIFSSNEIKFSEFTYPINYPKGFVYDVLPFELRSLKVIEEFRTPKDRFIQYYLTGPQGIWNFNLRVEVVDEKILPREEIIIKVDEILDFEIKLNVLKRNGKDKNNRLLEYEYEILALTFTSKLDCSKLSDEEFIKITSSYVDDILLLVSFLCRKRIEWFCYKLFSENRITTSIRDKRNVNPEEQELFNNIIGEYNTYKFLQKCLPYYRTLKTQNFDLKVVLIYYLSSQEMPYLESEFSTLFTSLEYLKTLYVEREKKENIIKKNKFDKLRKILKCSLNEFIKSNPNLSQDKEKEIEKKLPELNRFSISTIVIEMCSLFDIEIDSLYPKGEKITLFKTRNKLIHQSSNIDIEILFREYYRLRIIVELLILNFLKWEELSELTDNHIMKVVTEKINNCDKI